MKYFSEATFKNNLTESKFYLPYYIIAENEQKAVEAKIKLENGIKERYELLNSYGLVPVIKGLNSDSIRSAFGFSKGKISRLKINTWDFLEFDTDYELSFEKNLSTAVKHSELPLPLEQKTIASVIHNKYLPVQVIAKKYEDYDELLIINVIK